MFISSAKVMNYCHFRGCSIRNIRLMFHKRFPLRYGLSGKNQLFIGMNILLQDKEKSKKEGDSRHIVNCVSYRLLLFLMLLAKIIFLLFSPLRYAMSLLSFLQPCQISTEPRLQHAKMLSALQAQLSALQAFLIQHPALQLFCSVA